LGCGSLGRIHGDWDDIAKDKRFGATRMDLCFLWGFWADSGGSSSIINPGALKLLTPVVLVDLPLAVVLDTVYFPFDVCDYIEANKAEQFWESVFETGNIDLKEAQKYVTPLTSRQIREAIEADRKIGAIAPSIVPAVLDFVTASYRGDITVALSRHEVLTKEHYHLLYSRSKPNSEVRRNLARNPGVPLNVLKLLAASQRDWLRIEAISTGRLPAALVGRDLDGIANASERTLVRSIASHKATPPRLLRQLSEFECWAIREAVAANPYTPVDVLDSLAKSKPRGTSTSSTARRTTCAYTLLANESEVRSAVAGNAATPVAVLLRLSRDESDGVRAAAAGNRRMPHGVLKELASASSFRVRASVAQNLSAPRRVLNRLRQDECRYVRRCASETLKKRKKSKR